MNLSTQPYKGARDFYPPDKRIQKYMFGVLREVVEKFGYQEYDAPIIEPVEIYLAKTGEEIVNEQLYSFEDKGGRKVAIRPEMTPSVSRMVAGRRQELAYPLRWYSIPNLWRYERPQAGRLREHWQLNVDIFGIDGIGGDHEIISVANDIMRTFGAPDDSYVIRVSSRQLVDEFFRQYMRLNERQYYQTIKLIDRWHKIDRADFQAQAKEILSSAKQYTELIDLLESKSLDSLPAAVREHSSAKQLAELVELLNVSNVKSAEFDFSVIRGMDYYNNIVFEVFDTDPSNIRSMFGGGRYDGLVGLFGAETISTVGFGMGDVTLQRFLEAHKLLPKLEVETDAVAILIGDVYAQAQTVMQELRLAGAKVAIDSTGRKLDAQIRSAVKSGVRYALFIGETELNSQTFKLRDLQKGQEHELTIEQIASTLNVRRAA
ncbi:MAG TPA: histidine--tRNA ligase [Candidatus Saccharimonadales bacterium]|nr:histidine--tRNA ligase [Candidatus Saccharimonadales bacterium]